MNVPQAPVKTPPLAQRNVPSLIALSVMAFGLVALLYWQALTLVDLRFVSYLSACYDFGVFYNAAMAIRQGLSPYDGTGYVFPPLTAYLLVPVTYLDFRVLRVLLPLSTFVSLVTSLALLTRFLDPELFRRGRLRESLLVLLMICLGLGFSYPFLFLSNRANIDGYVLLLLCAGVVLMRKDSLWPAPFFALAVMGKVYPALIALPLLVFRRWKLLLVFGLVLLGVAAFTPWDWKGFFEQQLSWRAVSFRSDENASLPSTFYFAGMLVDQILGLEQGVRILFGKSGFVAYGIMLALSLFGDWRRDRRLRAQGEARPDRRAEALLYIPFMVAIPKVSFQYTLVCLLLILPVLSRRWISAGPRERGLLTWISVGVGVSQAHAVALAELSGSLYGHAVPGLGLLMVLIGLTALKLGLAGEEG
jgi:uncharacterized membrane protein